MCGRYLVETEEEILEMRAIINEVNRRYTGMEALSELRTGEVFPTQTALVLAAAPGGTQARLMKWGFPLFGGKGVVINARAETAGEKSMFRAPLQTRRAVVPTTGFYEWTHTPDGKTGQRYVFRLPDARVLYLAGLYNLFAEEDGARTERFTILTTAANASMEPFHGRMPVLLLPDERDAWLRDPTATGLFLSRVPPELEAAAA